MALEWSSAVRNFRIRSKKTKEGKGFTQRARRQRDGREAKTSESCVRKSALELLAAEDEPDEFGVEEEDGGGDDPGDDYREARVGELAHLVTVARELNQRDDGKG